MNGKKLTFAAQPQRQSDAEMTRREPTASFFDEVYFQALTSRFDTALTSREIDWIVSAGELQESVRILDLGCGDGRHAIPLAALGHQVTGVDSSPHAVARAMEETASRGLSARFLSCNASQFDVGAEEYDLVISWQTSLGIVASGNDDAGTLRNAFSALRSCGILLVEFTSAPWILRNYAKRAWRVTRAGVEVMEERDYCARRGVITTVARVIEDGKVGVARKLEIRLYSAPELIELVTRVGFVGVEICGDLDGLEYTIDSRRLLLRAFKP